MSLYKEVNDTALSSFNKIAIRTVEIYINLWFYSKVIIHFDVFY